MYVLWILISLAIVLWSSYRALSSWEKEIGFFIFQLFVRFLAKCLRIQGRSHDYLCFGPGKWKTYADPHLTPAYNGNCAALIACPTRLRSNLGVISQWAWGWPTLEPGSPRVFSRGLHLHCVPVNIPTPWAVVRLSYTEYSGFIRILPTGRATKKNFPSDYLPLSVYMSVYRGDAVLIFVSDWSLLRWI